MEWLILLEFFGGFGRSIFKRYIKVGHVFVIIFFGFGSKLFFWFVIAWFECCCPIGKISGVKASCNNSYNYLTFYVTVYGGSENNVGVRVSGSSNRFGSGVDFVHSQVVTTNNVK